MPKAPSAQPFGGYGFNFAWPLTSLPTDGGAGGFIAPRDLVTLWRTDKGAGDWVMGIPSPAFILDEGGDPILAESGDFLLDQGSDLTDSFFGDTPSTISNLDLQTSVLISLFTDGQASPDDVIQDGSGDPRGWWGDLGSSKPIGSKLWLLGRSKQTSDVLVKAKQYCADALQWLIDDGVASSVDVDASYPQNGTLAVQITIHRGDGKSLKLAYSWVWQGVV